MSVWLRGQLEMWWTERIHSFPLLFFLFSCLELSPRVSKPAIQTTAFPSVTLTLSWPQSKCSRKGELMPYKSLPLSVGFPTRLWLLSVALQWLYRTAFWVTSKTCSHYMWRWNQQALVQSLEVWVNVFEKPNHLRLPEASAQWNQRCWCRTWLFQPTNLNPVTLYPRGSHWLPSYFH